MFIRKIILLFLLITSQNSFSEGLVFECDETNLKRIEVQLEQYFNKLKIEKHFFHKEIQKNSIQFNLKLDISDTNYKFLKISTVC
mgnify:CR=1 FL=1